MTASAVPTVTTAITAEVASSTSRTWDRVIPSMPKVTPSALSRSTIALDDLTRGDRGGAEGDNSERDENDDQRAKRFVDRVLLLTAHRLEIVTVRAEGGHQVALSIEAGRQINVADRVHGQLTMRLVEGTREHHDAEDHRLVADRLDGHGADSDDGHSRPSDLRESGCEQVELEALTDLEVRRRWPRCR